jgi:AcrR family transcriptional regulator
LPRLPGRPRSEEAHQAILDATNELLRERGFADLTMDDIAQRAGVSKATIYRRWPTKGTLVFEAFGADYLTRQPVPDTGSLRGDLEESMRRWIRSVKGTDMGRTLVSLIAEMQRDEELADSWREHFMTPVREKHKIMFDRAVARGEVSQRIDSDVLLDLLYGPMYHRLLQRHLPVTERFAQVVINTVLAGIAPGAHSD